MATWIYGLDQINTMEIRYGGEPEEEIYAYKSGHSPAGQYDTSYNPRWFRAFLEFPTTGIVGYIARVRAYHWYSTYWEHGTGLQKVDVRHITETDPGKFPQAELDTEDWDIATEAMIQDFINKSTEKEKYYYYECTEAFTADRDAGRPFAIQLKGDVENEDGVNNVYYQLYSPSVTFGPEQTRPDGTWGYQIPMIRVEFGVPPPEPFRGGLHRALMDLVLGV